MLRVYLILAVLSLICIGLAVVVVWPELTTFRRKGRS
jgi:hypothetical protein